ncbi:unnamed protein product [Tilletia laevis]|uniref:Uncharacterized protein n=3 Tax=Tilletia TaxID=13289 RepID=A0A9N8QME7_9BASI|nr:hypothetical protein CF336_g2276 [Tilletia laevis]CAD6884482.1 unnamed protein product [Tilletia caries]KAE8202506.1 hypothetical protein CF335_g3388 [Tilletia laevis]CAD6903905.1 unnamed protein product [Tilletia caries]CAD6957409.1 unnamed protein product [Tilletia caries]
MNLDNLTHPDESYSSLKRFIIRAPSVHVVVDKDGPLTKRLRKVEEFGIAVARLSTPVKNWQWALKLMGSTPKLKACEFAVSALKDDASEDLSPIKIAKLPDLTDLLLELNEVDSVMLRMLDAPSLINLRVHSIVNIDHWHPCPLGHFPSLFAVTMWLPGQSAARLDALGIPRSKYYHNLNDTHNYSIFHEDSFTAYIKPYVKSSPSTIDAESPSSFFQRAAAQAREDAADEAAEAAAAAAADPADTNNAVAADAEALTGDAEADAAADPPSTDVFGPVQSLTPSDINPTLTTLAGTPSLDSVSNPGSSSSAPLAFPASPPGRQGCFQSPGSQCDGSTPEEEPVTICSTIPAEERTSSASGSSTRLGRALASSSSSGKRPSRGTDLGGKRPRHR